MAEQACLPNRRRVLRLIAAGSTALLPSGDTGIGRGRRWVWRGSALGAEATLILHHPDRRAALAMLTACLDEVERLERQFSLFRADSAVSRLNRNGVLPFPSLDMQVLLAHACLISEASSGAFDVTVQPLWQLYARHFTEQPWDLNGPSASAIDAARRRVDYRGIEVRPDEVRLLSGMAVTLNGIAQGYITDRVADLLRQRGWSNVLIELGECRALGGHPDGRPWSIALDRPAVLASELPILDVRDQAVATSSAAGTPFEHSGRHHHLFNPYTGCSAEGCAQVTVVSDRATLADALSTALFVVPAEARAALLRRFANTEAIVVGTDGQMTRLGA